MEGPNLIVTYDPAHGRRARARIRGILAEAGKKQAQFLPKKVPGLAELRVGSDPKQLVAELRARCEKDASAFAGTFRWIPVEHYEEASRGAIQRIAREMDGRISDDESWGIRVRTHDASMGSREVTRVAAEWIEHPHVDLDAPRREARFEVIGDHVAAALLAPRERLNANEYRRGAPPEPPEGPEPPRRPS